MDGWVGLVCMAEAISLLIESVYVIRRRRVYLAAGMHAESSLHDVYIVCQVSPLSIYYCLLGDTPDIT